MSNIASHLNVTFSYVTVLDNAIIMSAFSISLIEACLLNRLSSLLLQYLLSTSSLKAQRRFYFGSLLEIYKIIELPAGSDVMLERQRTALFLITSTGSTCIDTVSRVQQGQPLLTIPTKDLGHLVRAMYTRTLGLMHFHVF